MMKFVYFILIIISLGYFIWVPYLFQQGKITESELIALIGVFPLALIAIFQEHFKRWFFAPRLTIEFKHEEPFSIRSEFTEIQTGKFVAFCYFFRFQAVNIGKSQAKLCEAILEEFWENTAGGWKKSSTFQPVNLIWSNNKVKDEFLNVNPQARWFCDIGHIDQRNSIFIFDVMFRPNSQPEMIKNGISSNQRCKIKITLYSENAEKVSQNFIIEWSGNWKNDPIEMFNEIKIKKA